MGLLFLFPIIDSITGKNGKSLKFLLPFTDSQQLIKVQ